MHIPNDMLQGNICPVTSIISAAGLLIAGYHAAKIKDKPSASRFGAVSALIFAGQMINFPITSGTSGHLLGGVLAVKLLGVPFAILSVALVVAIQCLTFADGGLAVLGANIFNMSLIGAGLMGLLYSNRLQQNNPSSFSSNIELLFISAISVVAASFAVSLELAISGTISFYNVIASMVGTHALIGIGEGLITIAACLAFKTEKTTFSDKKSVVAPLATAGVTALVLSPFASGSPDGLLFIAEKYRFFHESAPTFAAPFSDYLIPGISNTAISTGLSGFIGVIITFTAALILKQAYAHLKPAKAKI